MRSESGLFINEQRAVGVRSSFRDPGGVLVASSNRILRLIAQSGLEDVRAFLTSKVATRSSGRVVGTSLISEEEKRDLLRSPELSALAERIGAVEILEHERITFPSFPYEWAPEMLEAAGQLTLSLARECLKEDLGLKDATPLNILFRGNEPVFIDVLSFERRNPKDPTWLPYAQFVRTFLLPLLANRYFGIPIAEALLSRRDGIEPEELYRWLGPLDRLRPSLLSNVSIPVWLGSRHKRDDTSIYQTKTVDDPEKARFIVDSLLQRLQKALSKAAPKDQQQSTWSDYMTGNNNYSREQFEAKELFVSQVMKEFVPTTVLHV